MRLFLLFFCSLFCMPTFQACGEADAGCNTEVNTTCISKEGSLILPTDSFLSYEGRVSFLNPLAPRFTYPGVTIHASFEGTSLRMLAKPQSGYFMVQVDKGAPFKVDFSNRVDSIVVLASGLSNSVHEVSIMNCIEAYQPIAEFRGLMLDKDCHLQAMKQETTSLKLEFIGNSITCGYGIESASRDDPFLESTENHYFTYAALTARRLNARHIVVAKSGIGIYRNYGGPYRGSADCMPNMYDYTLYGDTTERWDFASYTPDIVFVNLGTNDCVLEGYSYDLLKLAYVQFQQKLRTAYPFSKIIWLSGCMLNGTPLYAVQKAMNEMVAGAKMAGDTLVYRFDFSPQTGDLGYGAGWHPSKKQHQRMAEELITFLQANIL